MGWIPFVSLNPIFQGKTHFEKLHQWLVFQLCAMSLPYSVHYCSPFFLLLSRKTNLKEVILHMLENDSKKSDLVCARVLLPLLQLDVTCPPNSSFLFAPFGGSSAEAYSRWNILLGWAVLVFSLLSEGIEEIGTVCEKRDLSLDRRGRKYFHIRQKKSQLKQRGQTPMPTVPFFVCILSLQPIPSFAILSWQLIASFLATDSYLQHTLPATDS